MQSPLEKGYNDAKSGISSKPLKKYSAQQLQEYKDGYAVGAHERRNELFNRAPNPPRLKRVNPYVTNQRDVAKATKLYKDFREQAPRRGRVVEFSVPKVVMIMGNVNAIEYDTTRKGLVEKYRHDFAAGSRPFLCADARTGQLFIVEGRYHVTERGIVDLDSKGKELE